MIKLVLDTNTIISGFLWRGNEYELLLKIEEGKAQMYLNNEILQEIHRVLHYPRLSKYIIKSGLTDKEIIEKILELSEFIEVSKTETTVCRDKDDNKFFECALAAQVDFIVSGDEDILTVIEFEGIKTIRTNEILKILSE